MKNTQSIFGNLKAELENRSGVAISDGGDMALRLYAVAAELSSLWTQVEWTQKQMFPQTATGLYLDYHARARSLERGAAACAYGEIKFETQQPSIQDIQIPLGTVCVNSAGAEFVTTDHGIILAGQSFCTVNAKAKNPGSGGNAPAQSVCFMVLAPIGVSQCHNPAAFFGGTDGEDDEALRSRVLASYASLPNGSNAAYYKTKAMNTDGVAAAFVMPRARGLGTVDIIISSAAGMPSPELVSGLKESFEREREICVDAAVLQPAAVPVTVEIQIDVKEGFSSDTTVTLVERAISEYFDGKMLGKNVLLAHLGSIVFAVEGVLNYKILQPTADIKIMQNQLPTAETITVTRS